MDNKTNASESKGFRNDIRVMFDANVILCALFGQGAEREWAAAALALAQRGRLSVYLCAGAVASLYEELVRVDAPAAAQHQLAALRECFRVAAVTEAVVDAALALGWPYLEDALTYQSARNAGLDLLVSLDPSDFPVDGIRVTAPRQLLAELATETESQPH